MRFDHHVHHQRAYVDEYRPVRFQLQLSRCHGMQVGTDDHHGGRVREDARRHVGDELDPRSVTDDEEAVYAVVAGAGGPAARLQDHPQLRVLHGLRAEVAYYSPGAHEREEAGRLDARPGVRGGHGATSWTWFPALSRRRCATCREACGR